MAVNQKLITTSLILQKILITNEYYVFQDAKCCLFPPFFVREIARECGAIFSLKYRSVEHNITTFRREAMTVGTPKEEAKFITMLLKSVYENAIRGIKNRTNSEKFVISIKTYRTNAKRSEGKNELQSRKRRHKYIINHQSPHNLIPAKNQRSPQKQTSSSPSHQSYKNQNKSSKSHSFVRFYLSILSLID